MRIKEISVRKLFGIFDHVIPLNLEQRITVVHGLNGVGKTVLLRMIDGLCNKDLSTFMKIPFEEFIVRFEDDSYIKVTRSYKKSADISHILKLYYFHSNDSNSDKEKPWTIPVTYSMVLGSKRNPLQIQDDIYSKIIEHEKKSPIYDEDDENYINRIRHDRELAYFPGKSVISKAPSWYKQFCNSINIKLLDTYRLRSYGTEDDNNKRLVDAVTAYSEELSQNITQNYQKYAVLSEKLDSNFANRFLRGAKDVDVKASVIRTKLKDLKEINKSLKEVGLLTDAIKIPKGMKFKTTEKKFLYSHLNDVEQKFKVFEKLAEKLTLFKNTIDRIFRYKELIITRDGGLVFLTETREFLRPEELSSGEQHEIVMLYQLLFKVKPDTMVLIDEPEISLHIAWQDDFIKDLIKITDQAAFDVLLATHSPSIISDRWDLTVQLKGSEEC